MPDFSIDESILEKKLQQEDYKKVSSLKSGEFAYVCDVQDLQGLQRVAKVSRINEHKWKLYIHRSLLGRL